MRLRIARGSENQAAEVRRGVHRRAGDARGRVVRARQRASRVGFASSGGSAGCGGGLPRSKLVGAVVPVGLSAPEPGVVASFGYREMWVPQRAAARMWVACCSYCTYCS